MSVSESEAKTRKRLSEEVEEEVGEFSTCFDVIRTHTDAIVNIIANPSLKISRDNQKEIKRLLNVVVEQALIQNNAVSSFLGRLMEQKDMAYMLLESREKTT